MIALPNPTALRSLIKEEDLDRHRSVSCAEYDACLGAVLRRDWKSWTCKRCGLFSFAREWTRAEVAHEGALRRFA